MKTAGILVAIFIILATGNSVRAEDGCIKNLFQWDKIPGDDNSKLKDILKQHGFDWVDDAQITKIDSGKIKVYTSNSILNIRLENGKVKFNDQEINGIKVKDYNDGTIICDNSDCSACNKNSFGWYKIISFNWYKIIEDYNSKLKDFLNRHGYNWANSVNFEKDKDKVKTTSQSDEIYNKGKTQASIPEFPSIALPIGVVMAMMYIAVRRRGN